jgi:4-oxalocrotonate tautomerase
MPLAQITIVRGRDPEMIERMAAAVTDAIVNTLGAPRSAIRVAVNEIPAEHWFIAGESMARRVDAPQSDAGSNG